MVLPASQDPWEFHEHMPGEFWGQRKSANVVLSSPHLSPRSAFSPRTSPLLSCVGLPLSYWSIQTTLTQSSQLYFRPHLFSWVPLGSWSWSWWVLMVTFVFICGPRTGARVACLWLTALLKTGSKLAARRWSFAPEIQYRFKPILKMHLVSLWARVKSRGLLVRNPFCLVMKSGTAQFLELYWNLLSLLFAIKQVSSEDRVCVYDHYVVLRVSSSSRMRTRMLCIRLPAKQLNYCLTCL